MKIRISGRTALSPALWSADSNNNLMRFRKEFDYKYEEPLYNVDTEPRFFKKTFEALSGILTHTFHPEDSNDLGKMQNIHKDKLPTKSNKKEIPKHIVNKYSEKPKRLQFPKNQDYRNVSSHKTNNDVSTFQQVAGGNFETNSWKPSQR